MSELLDVLVLGTLLKTKPSLTQEEDKLNNLVPWRLKGIVYIIGRWCGDVRGCSLSSYPRKGLLCVEHLLIYAQRLCSD